MIKRKRCSHCQGCKADDCDECRYCIDMPKFGGPGKRKKCTEDEEYRMLGKSPRNKSSSYNVAIYVATDTLV